MKEKFRPTEETASYVSMRLDLEIARRPHTTALLARLRKFRSKLPMGFKFDRLESNKR